MINTGPIPALPAEVRMRIRALSEAGTPQDQIATMLGISQSTVCRIAPRKKYQRLVESMRLEAIELLAARVPRKLVAEHLGVSTARIDAVVWEAKDKGLLPRSLGSSAHMTVKAAKDQMAAEQQPVPMWTRARQLAVARRIKARWNWDHIAADLCELPGPKVHVRDVLQYAGRVVAT